MLLCPTGEHLYRQIAFFATLSLVGIKLFHFNFNSIRSFTDVGSRRSAKRLTTSVFWLVFHVSLPISIHCISIGRYWLYLVLNVKLATIMTPRTKSKEVGF